MCRSWAWYPSQDLVLNKWNFLSCEVSESLVMYSRSSIRPLLLWSWSCFASQDLKQHSRGLHVCVKFWIPVIWQRPMCHGLGLGLEPGTQYKANSTLFFMRAPALQWCSRSTFSRQFFGVIFSSPRPSAENGTLNLISGLELGDDVSRPFHLGLVSSASAKPMEFYFYARSRPRAVL